MNSLPKISVIMSVYNEEKYLKDSIESILNQTFKDFEFLIINDSSIDNSLNIIKSYKDPRIRVINNSKNIGLSKSLNIGLQHAQGQYMARMDADDISLPNRLEEQLKFLEINKDITLIGCQVELIDENNQIIGYKKSRPKDFDIVKFWIITKNPFIHSTFFLKMEEIKKINGYNEKYKYSQDFEICSRLIEKKYKIVNMPSYLLKFRRHNKSITKTLHKRKAQLEYALLILQKNINKYIKLNKNDTRILINTINKQETNIIYLIKSLIFYKKIFNSFIKKENLNNNQIEIIKKIYKEERNSMLGFFIKNKIPIIYKILKKIKPIF